MQQRTWLLAAIVVLIANAAFLAFNLAASVAPVEPLLERVRTAFATGELTRDDWRFFDSRRGANQYNDCLILMFAIDRSAPPLARSVGPVVTYRDMTWEGHCRTLAELSRADPVVAPYMRYPYARYWHGYVPVTVALLQFLELEEARQLLKALVYASLLLLLMAAGTAHRGLFILAAAISLTGLLFWALPYYAQSPSHGPGDAFVILGLAFLLAWRERLTREELLIPFCAVYGAGIVYLEFLTGLLPTAAALLIPAVYLMRESGRTGPPNAWPPVGIALLAFAFGAGLTVLLKQVLAVAFIGPEVLAPFLDKLHFWTGLAEPSAPGSALEGRLAAPLLAVLRKGGSALAYGSIDGARALFAATVLAWGAASWLAVRNQDRRRLDELLAFAAGAGVIVAWIIVFPEHTAGHEFMARMFIVPIALGWAALACQVRCLPQIHAATAGALHEPGR
jgi:hypothetical protein